MAEPVTAGANKQPTEGVLALEAYYTDIAWSHHPLREFLLKKLLDGAIPVESKEMKPRAVWDKFCHDGVFKGFEYDNTFTRRLNDLRKSVSEGKTRAGIDLKAFEIAKKNHPVPLLNHRGEPQWNGSAAQKLLQQDMKNNQHFLYKPEDLWNTRPEYQQFLLSTFRDHIHQNWQTSKYVHTLKEREAKKNAEKADEAKERKLKEIGKKQRDEDRARKQAEKDAEKKAKADARAAAKHAKEEAKRIKAEEQAAKRAAQLEAKKKREEETAAKKTPRAER